VVAGLFGLLTGLTAPSVAAIALAVIALHRGPRWIEAMGDWHAKIYRLTIINKALPMMQAGSPELKTIIENALSENRAAWPKQAHEDASAVRRRGKV
jgi:hypothetical protein